MRIVTVFSVLTAAAWLLCSCESPTRGCIDVEATNFDVSADRACEDNCCTYPQLIINVDQEYNGAIWRQDSAYQNDLGQWFRIKSISYYLSEVLLTRNGAPFVVSDSVEMRVFGAAPGDTLRRYFRDDYLLVRRFQTDYPVGTFRAGGVFDGFQCAIGLNASANGIVPRYAPSGHPLAKQNDSLWLSRTEGFALMQIVLTRDTFSATSPDTLRFTLADWGGTPALIQKSGVFEQETGFDFRLTLTADYAQMFKGVDFANSGVSAWKSAVISNLGATFDVSQ